MYKHVFHSFDFHSIAPRAFPRRTMSCLLALTAMASGLPSTELHAAELATSHWQRVVLLQDYNTRVVLFGTLLLGLCGGIVGVFMLLRKRPLLGDVVGHSALPGIAVAFIVSQIIAPGSGKNLTLLALGAFFGGLCGALSVLLIDRYSKIRADAALAIALSLFYGLGAALLTVIQRMPTASAAGLNSFLNGKTASITSNDVWFFAISALVLSVVTLLLFKEFCLLCFEDEYAAAAGWPVLWLDALLLGLVVGVTIVGMQTVGLILVVAILIIPAAAARFWSDNLRHMTAISAVIGALSAGLGTILSALAPHVAAGAVIVLSGSGLFLISLLFGARRGFLWRKLNQQRLHARTGRHDLLRAAYEYVESAAPDDDISEPRLLQARLGPDRLLQMRSWSAARLRRLLHRAVRDDVMDRNSDGTYSLTPDGAALARRAVRNHRLWEMYLITYADVAPSHADYDADRIEHVLGTEMVRELERRLGQEDDKILPASPHQLP
jgi:manganese/zinc/iron transport system permease protein